MKILTVLLLILLSAPAVSVSAQQQKGKASYYGRKFEGRRMSSGAVYRGDSMFCAHRTYPFGTLLKVTNMSNGKTVVVKVMDRGPYGRGRIIDLSLAAARKIDMVSAGIVNVTVTPYKSFIIPFRPEPDLDDLPDYGLDAVFGDDDEPWLPTKSNSTGYSSDDMWSRYDDEWE